MKENIYQCPVAVSLLALLCCAMWGSAFPCIKIGYAMMNISGAGSQLLYGGLRFLLAGVMTLAFARLSRKGPLGMKREELPATCGQGLLLKYNPVSRVTIFGFSIPVFGICYSAVLLHEQAFTLRNLAALALVCVGILIVNRTGTAAKTAR